MATLKIYQVTEKAMLRYYNKEVCVCNVYKHDSFEQNEGIEVSKSGNVQYSITGNERRFFTIDPITGKIVLERPLDRESASVWRLNVIAKDGGLPNPLEGTCVVEIEVTDVNDNFPIFTNPSVNNSLLYASTQDETGVIAHVKVNY